jgi:hypothetical protein
MRAILGAAMEQLDDLNSAPWTRRSADRQYSPLANSAALVLAIILICAPWFTGAAWLAVYFWHKPN